MNTLELVEVGDSVGVILPKDLLERLKVVEGDTLFLMETADGFRLTTDDSQSEAEDVAIRSPTKATGPKQCQNKK